MKAGQVFKIAGLAWLVLLGGVASARAQSANESPAAQALEGGGAPGASGPPGGASGFGHVGGQSHPGSAPGSMPTLKPIIAPRQRLDAGALLCHTEAQLRQHQAAMMARLAGRPAQEAGGCRVVGQTEAVSVLTRDGQAATEVQIGGDDPIMGWTDAVIRESDPFHVQRLNP